MAFFLMTKKNDKKLRELRETFDAADKDGDGKLSPAEWLCVLKEGGVDATELIKFLLDNGAGLTADFHFTL